VQPPLGLTAVLECLCRMGDLRQRHGQVTPLVPALRSANPPELPPAALAICTTTGDRKDRLIAPVVKKAASVLHVSFFPPIGLSVTFSQPEVPLSVRSSSAPLMRVRKNEALAYQLSSIGDTEAGQASRLDFLPRRCRNAIQAVLHTRISARTVCNPKIGRTPGDWERG
jgi:hypothetical protein